MGNSQSTQQNHGSTIEEEENTPLLNNNNNHEEASHPTESEPNELTSTQTQTQTQSQSQSTSANDIEAQNNQEENESTPLLSRTEIPHYSILKKIFKPNWIHLILLLVILTASIAYLTLDNIENAINDSIDINIHNTTLENLTSSGVNINVQGSITLDYNKIQNNYIQKSVLKLGSFLVGGITIKSLKPIQIHVKLIDVDSPYLYLLDTIPPPIYVDIKQLHTTNLNISSNCSLGQTQFFEFLKYYYKLNSNEINMDLKIFGDEFEINTLKFISFNLKDIEINDQITIKKEDLKLPPSILKIEKLDITSSTPNVIDLNINLLIANDYGLTLDLNFMSWDLLFNDCNNKLIKVGNWTTLPTNITPGKLISIQVIGQITDVPNCLMEDCFDRVSPINQMVQNYLNENPINFAIHLNNYQPDNKLNWLLENLKKLPPIELSIKLPRIKIPLTKIESNSTDILMNNENNKTFGNEIISTIISNNSTFQFLNSLNLPIDLKKFKINFNIGLSDDLLLSASSKDFVYSTVNQVKDLINIGMSLSDLDVEIINPSYVGKVINKLINDRNDDLLICEDLHMNISLTDIEMSLPLMKKANIKQLDLTQLQIPSRFDITSIDSNLNIDTILQQLNITIDQIYLYEVSKNSIEFLIESSIYNPLNITLDIPQINQQIINLGLLVNQTKIGVIKFKEIYLPKHEKIDLILNIKFQFNKLSEKQILQDFISEYISSNSSSLGANQILSIGNNSVLNNYGLELFLREISIIQFSLPNITFTIPEYKATYNEITARSTNNEIIPKSTDNELATQDLKVFVLDIIIHILTSEIEIKIYNPIKNSEIKIQILSSIAKYDNIILGYLNKIEYLIIPPGFYTSPKLPIKIYYGSSRDLLRKNLNQDLDIDIFVEFILNFDDFNLRLLYKGKNLSSKIRL
ncbi:uncharacterized protein KGF55_004940 [Candida pseudojiufengensis]|uniref:uncharacterized protein n=1 Tax=Candida pseudojiufengensis TaxID=497109 RepID=UPI002225B0E0|nr:uncharacterized protein KGF55_004940 [Candida pseudojiufengensis]KAI5959708.1 hypothetical protein KGF55_004940 [Candida pseudojiufengensis]